MARRFMSLTSVLVFACAQLCLVYCVAAGVVASDASSSVDCAAWQYLDPTSNTCIEYANPSSRAGEDRSVTLDTGNTAWMLTAGALVMLMTPGVAFFYAGLAGEELAANTIMMSFGSMALISIQFFVFGYSVGFGSDGLFGWAAYRHVTQIPSGVYGNHIPHVLYAFFQTQFAMITPALLSGGIVGRMKYNSFIIFIFLWSCFVYDPLARWIWSKKLSNDYDIESQGWEGVMGSLDFAGGTVIHVSSGFGALVATLVVGRRYNYGEPVRPHNMPLVMIGCTLLWFGWFGFNGGSAGAANGIAAMAVINSHLSASAGFLSWTAVAYKVHGKVDPCGSASGAVAGMVAITSGCGYVQPWAATIYGAVSSSICFVFIQVKNYARYDDTLDAFAIHGCSGFIGGILTGLFATSDINPSITGGAFYGNPAQLWRQFVSQCIAATYSSIVTFALLMGLKYTIGLRVAEGDGMTDLTADIGLYRRESDDYTRSVDMDDLKMSSIGPEQSQQTDAGGGFI